MNNEDKNISKFLKDNYKVSDDVSKKMDAAFSKLEKPKHKFTFGSILGKVAMLVVALYLSGNAIALAFGEDNIYTAIYRYFTPTEDEKIDSIIIEGEKEDVDYNGLESSLGYIIQYSTDDFDLNRSGDKDYYTSTIEGFSDTVYFVIYKSDELYNTFKTDDATEFQIDNKNAFYKEFIDGQELNDDFDNSNLRYDSDVVDIWYIDNADSTYIVETHCFLEAVEGWGTRMSQIVNSLKIID